MNRSSFQIRSGKTFPNLPNAPIVEAVLQWQASATIEFVKSNIQSQLESSFPQYEIVDLHNIEAAFTGSAQGIDVRHASTWEGFRLTFSENEKPVYVCQFKKDGIAFSQLAPYRGWDKFVKEGLKFWDEYVKNCHPQSIAKLSVRYISQMAVESPEDVAEFIDMPDAPLSNVGFPSDSFFYQDTVNLPKEPYTIQVTRALQPQSITKDLSKVLIVDIDVATSEGISNISTLPVKLEELRDIKNEVFFGMMKDAVVKFGSRQG